MKLLLRIAMDRRKYTIAILVNTLAFDLVIDGSSPLWPLHLVPKKPVLHSLKP